LPFERTAEAGVGLCDGSGLLLVAAGSAGLLYSSEEIMDPLAYMATHLLAGMLAARPELSNPFESMDGLRVRLARTAVTLAYALVEQLNKQAEAAPHSVREDDGEP